MNKNMNTKKSNVKKVPANKLERFVKASTALGSMVAHMQYALGPYSA